MKKYFLFFLSLAALALCLLTGCAKEPTAPKKAETQLCSDACISPLRWGMTRSEAEEALAGYPITDEGKGFSFAAELFGQTVTAAAKFEMPDDAVVPVPEQTEPVLVGIDVAADDGAAFKKSLNGVLGEPLTHQVVYFDENGSAGIKDGAELPEEARYWRSEKKLTDVFTRDEIGKVDFGTAADRLRYEDKRAWVVTSAPVEGGTAFVFDGSMLALRAVLDKA